MPKLKTRKAFAKRIKISKRGKALHSKAGRRHLLSGRSEKRKRHLRKRNIIAGVEMKVVRTAMPYA